MASTNKTPQLGLNQWAAGDEVLRADFNADNAKLDTMVGRGTCVTGRFVGNGVNNRVIELGFKPKCVFLIGDANGRSTTGFIIKEFGFFGYGDGTTQTPTEYMTLVETGFKLIESSFFNGSQIPVFYIAFY